MKLYPNVRRFLFITISLIIVVLVSFQVSNILYVTESEQSDQKFNEEVQKLKNSLGNRIDIYLNVLNSAKAFFESSDYVDKGEFNNYFESLDLLAKYPGISGLTFIERVRDSEKDAFFEKVNSDTSLDSKGSLPMQLKTNSVKEEYYLFKYIEPFNPNSTSLGLDLSDNQSRFEAIRRAADSGMAAATGKITLLGATANQGFSIYLPVYKKGMPLNTQEERDSALIGLLNAVFRVNELFKGIFGDANEYKDIDIDIYHGQIHNEEHLLFDSENISDDKTNIIIKSEQLKVGDTMWDIDFKALSGFGLSEFEKNRPTTAFFAILLVGVLISALIYFLTDSRERAVRIAASITKQLKESEQSLKSVIEGVNVIIFTLNSDGDFSLLEGKGLELIGMKAGQLVGQNYTDFNSSSPEITNDMKEALAGKELVVSRKIADKTFEISYSCIKKNDKVVSVIGVAVDVTERVISKEKLEARTQELERLNKVMIDRELKMIELKDEIKKLKLNSK